MSNENFLKTMYAEQRLNKANTSFWLEASKKLKGVKHPETEVLIVPFEIFKDINYHMFDGDVEKTALGEKLLDELLSKSQIKKIYHLFFAKVNNFSCKFSFDWGCKCYPHNYKKNIENIMTTSALMGAGEFMTELTVRRYIEPDVNITIYNGMPLRTEFRVFYDFDKKQLLGCYNYWDYDTMVKNLQGSNLKTFQFYFPIMEKKFKEFMPKILKLNFEEIPLNGRWSIDFMISNDEIYLIDMATAETSYYYDRVKK